MLLLVVVVVGVVMVEWVVLRVLVRLVPEAEEMGSGLEVASGLAALGMAREPEVEGGIGEGVESFNVSASRAVTIESNWKRTSLTSGSMLPVESAEDVRSVAGSGVDNK